MTYESSYQQWRAKGGKLTRSKKFKKDNPQLFPYLDDSRHDGNRVGWLSVIAILFLFGMPLFYGVNRFNLFGSSDASLVSITSTPSDIVEFDDGTFSIVNQVTPVQFPTSVLVGVSATPSPTVTQVVTVTQDNLSSLYVTATHIAELWQATPEPVLTAYPPVGVTPDDGRWVLGWYPVMFCPTGYDCPCDAWGCRMQVPQNYQCDIYGCSMYPESD